MKKFIFFVIISFSFGYEVKLSTTQSIFSFVDNSDVYFHYQYSKLSKFKNIAYGFQWWPSNNLYFSGIFSKIVINNDQSLYHNSSIGYSNPNWKIYNFNKNVIELGIHRIRFYNDNILRWFHLGLKARKKIKNINFGIDFNRLFYNSWATNRYIFIMSKNFRNIINMNIGFIHDDMNFVKPYIGISLIL